MASTYSGVLSAPASTGSASFTGFGFTPKFVILTCTYQTTANTDETNAYWCQSFMTAATQICLGHSSQHGVSGSQNVTGTYSATALLLKNYSASTVLAATLVSFDSDGITLNFTTTSSGVKIGCFAIGGSGVTDAYIKTVTPKGSTGTQISTGVGFAADFMLSMAHAYASGTETNGYTGFGLCDSSLNQGCNVGFSDSGSLDNTGVWYNNKFVATTQSGLSIEQEASVSAISSDGFTLNYTTSTSTQGAIYVACIKTASGSAKVGTVTDKTTTTGTVAVTGVGFTPNALLILDNASGQNSGSAVLGNYMMLGACGPTVSNACVFGATSWGVKNSVAYRYYNTNQIIRNNVDAAKASLQSYDASGFTLNYTVVSVSGKERPYLALDIPASAGSSHKPGMSLLGVG